MERCIYCGKKINYGFMEKGSLWTSCEDCMDKLVDAGFMRPSNVRMGCDCFNEESGCYDRLRYGRWEPEDIFWTYF